MDDRDLPRGVASSSVTGPISVHFDGACEGGRGGSIATYGFTVDGPTVHLDGDGLAVPPFHERATNNVAEYVGAICGLEALDRIGYSGDVELVGDSQLVLRQMSGEYEVRAEHLRPYHERLVQLVGRFHAVAYRWVPREENARADELSKRALARARAELERPAGRPRGPPDLAQSDDGDPGDPQRTV